MIHILNEWREKLTGWFRRFMLALKAIVVGFVFAIIGAIILAFRLGRIELIYLGIIPY